MIARKNNFNQNYAAIRFNFLLMHF